jgi:hypothetical protein
MQHATDFNSSTHFCLPELLQLIHACSPDHPHLAPFPNHRLSPHWTCFEHWPHYDITHLWSMTYAYPFPYVSPISCCLLTLYLWHPVTWAHVIYHWTLPICIAVVYSWWVGLIPTSSLLSTLISYTRVASSEPQGRSAEQPISRVQQLHGVFVVFGPPLFPNPLQPLGQPQIVKT